MRKRRKPPTVADLAHVERTAQITFNMIEAAGYPARDALEVEFNEHWDRVKDALRREHSNLRPDDSVGRIAADTVLGIHVREALRDLYKWWCAKSPFIRLPERPGQFM